MMKTPGPAPAPELLDRIQGALTTISRRGLARVHEADGALSSVDHSVLAFIQSAPAPRAVDIAQHFALNRSTVSRQIASLTRQGLLRDRAPEFQPAGRATLLELTHDGERALARSAAVVAAAMAQRLSGWDEADLQLFAELLDRYNLDPEEAEEQG